MFLLCVTGADEEKEENAGAISLLTRGVRGLEHETQKQLESRKRALSSSDLQPLDLSHKRIKTDQ